MPTYSLSNLEPADNAESNDVLLLRSGGQDYRLPISVLANDLLSSAAGAAKVGIQAVGGMYADNVQDAIEELYDREDISPQPLDTTNSPTFAGLKVTGLANATPRMIVAGSTGTLTAVAHPDNVFPRTIFAQAGDVVVSNTASHTVLIPENSYDAGDLTIPASKWGAGACVEIQFEYEADNETGYEADFEFHITLGGTELTYDQGANQIRFTSFDARTNPHGSGSCFILCKDFSAPTEARLRFWMEMGGPEATEAVIPRARTEVREVQWNLTADHDVGLSVKPESASAELSFTVKNARVIWHPAPTGLA